jgi:hypothetical protein
MLRHTAAAAASTHCHWHAPLTDNNLDCPRPFVNTPGRPSQIASWIDCR